MKKKKKKENKSLKSRACLHKRKYECREEAEKARERYCRKYGGMMNTYHCQFCKKWHIGHSTKWRK